MFVRLAGALQLSTLRCTSILEICKISAFMVFAAILNQGRNKPADRMKCMANTAKELRTVSNVSVHL